MLCVSLERQGWPWTRDAEVDPAGVCGESRSSAKDEKVRHEFTRLHKRSTAHWDSQTKSDTHVEEQSNGFGRARELMRARP
jgi:hypothetical protein